MLDLLFLGFMVLAVFQGFKNGLVLAIFSIVGWVVGIYAALKFSGVVQDYLSNSIDISPRWLAIIAFVIVFLAVMLLVRLGALLIEKTLEIGMLGWANRLGGIFFYVLLYAFIFSVLINFAERVSLLNGETISSSKVYPWIKPFAHIIRLPFLG